MLETLLVALALESSAPATADTTPSPRTARADTTRARVVRRFEEIVVRAPLFDPRSSETVHRMPATAKRLPVDRLAEVVGLQTGVVARGQDLHVRGGRSGELAVEIDGFSLNEPLRGRPLEIPLIAMREADLKSGGLHAEYGGALAGVLDVKTIDPGRRTGAELLWTTDGRRGTEYDFIAARVDGPTGVPGLGVVLAGEARLDGTHLPSLRTASRASTPFGSFGWRDRNLTTGYFKLATPGSDAWSLQGIATRRVERPFDPMWTVDAWIDWCPEGDTVCTRPSIRHEEAPGHEYYRAADHKTLTDDRRQALLLTVAARPGAWRARGTLGWLRGRSITSLNGQDDERYVIRPRAPSFGANEHPDLDPFLVYAGDEPYFARYRSDVWSARADVERRTARGSGVKAGVGANYQEVAGREVDLGFPFGLADSVRSYHAWAPGGFGYAQGRWEAQGLVLSAGLRAQVFDPGTYDGPTWWPVPSRSLWTFSPRLGVAYPMSTRDAFSLAYVRLHQDPGRDYLYERRLAPFRRHPLGNPWLEPSEVISYQAGLKHLISETWAVQLGYFYRDLYGQIGARKNARRADTRQTYQNADVGHARGIELTLLGGAGEDHFELHYTYLEAWGTQSREDGVPYGPLMSTQAASIGDHPLDWDQRHRITLAGVWHPRPDWEVAWSTLAGSGFPWTPRLRRAFDADFSTLNTRRMAWSTTTDLAVRTRLPFARAVALGVEVRNLFDHRGEIDVTTDGYPHPMINSLYDDYSAHREETGLAGGGYWEDANGDGLPGWIRVSDPRLGTPPRAIRATLAVRWGGAAAP